jgi:hypothetical protein
MLENFPQILGNHVGIVVGVEDPEFRGRVQVYVPHLLKSMYEDFNDKFNKDIEDLDIDNLIKDFEPYIDRLRHTLPWAEASMPIFGGGTSYHGNWKSSPNEGERVYNVQDFPMNPNWASEELGGEYDSPASKQPRWNTCFEEILGNGLMSDYMSGFLDSKPGYQTFHQHHLIDMDMPSNMGTAASARGMLSVPAFGSKVWVFFLNGDIQRPVYFGQVLESACVLPVAR